jgi:centrosomal protein CEP104
VIAVDEVMTFLTPHLEHRDQGVREAMMDLAVALYENGGGDKMKPFIKELNPRAREIIIAKLPQNFADEFAQAKPPPKAKPPPPEPKAGGGGGGGGGGGDTNKGGAKKAGTKKVVPPHQHTPHEPKHKGDDPAEDSVGEFSLQGFCQFCGVEDATFTEEKLDLHYWQDCRMLTNCKQCEQVIEIPTLNEHLLEECEVAGKHAACPRCKEAVPADQLAEHKAKAACLPFDDKMNRCPLCHTDIPPDEDGWKQHLLDKACPQNPRKGGK